jgi:hypothetical protein
VGSTLHGIGGVLPFAAGPQLSPQGYFGDIPLHLAPMLNTIVHSQLANAIAQAAPSIVSNAGYPTAGRVLGVLVH